MSDKYVTDLERCASEYAEEITMWDRRASAFHNLADDIGGEIGDRIRAIITGEFDKFGMPLEDDE